MLSLIQRALRASIEGQAERVGPFVVRFDDCNDNPFLNYAIPDDDAAPASHDVDALIAAFIGRGRRPRLEYGTPSLDVDRALEAAGFVTDLELALMTATPATFIKPPVVSGLELQRMGPDDDDLWAVVSVQNAAYGGTGPVGEHDVDSRRATNEAVEASYWPDYLVPRSGPVCSHRRSTSWPRSPVSGFWPPIGDGTSLLPPSPP